MTNQELTRLLQDLPDDYPAPCVDKVDYSDLEYEEIEDYLLSWYGADSEDIVQLGVFCTDEANKYRYTGYAESTHYDSLDNPVEFLKQKLKRLYDHSD